jgi:hypothetical protein
MCAKSRMAMIAKMDAKRMSGYRIGLKDEITEEMIRNGIDGLPKSLDSFLDFKTKEENNVNEINSNS